VELSVVEKVVGSVRSEKTYISHVEFYYFSNGGGRGDEGATSDSTVVDDDEAGGEEGYSSQRLR